MDEFKRLKRRQVLMNSIGVEFKPMWTTKERYDKMLKRWGSRHDNLELYLFKPRKRRIKK